MNVLRRHARRPRAPFGRVTFIIGDLLDRWRNRNTMIPPRSLDFVGGSGFVEVGNEFARYFVELGKLQPDHRVLDVGCGIGRMAIPLTNILANNGAYYGFDIVTQGIKWCNSRIAPRFPNFHFFHSDVYNKSYNPNGKTLAKDYRFPFDDGFFDFAFLTSVFTHMLPDDLAHYLAELRRVLKSDGRCLITFFLLNEQSCGLIRDGKSTKKFVHALGGCSTTDPVTPEDAIAYKEEHVRELFAQNKLRIDEPIRYGSWCGRKEYLSYQDMVIATKL